MNDTILTAPTSHPVLIEHTETHLAWIDADTPEDAERIAEKLFATSTPQDGALADHSAQFRALTAEVAEWLDLDTAQYERIDAYFAARTGSGA